ncbi:MAG: response regulator [Chlorobiaceae bacterium]|nr:response regulator [Chlorobiaceae bacterium]NTV16589.1 response regulator [Chlorobiaceae bacterium]
MNPLTNTRVLDELVSIDKVEFKSEWQFEDRKTGVFYRNGVIPNKLFLTLLGGDIELESAKNAIKILGNMFRSGVLENCEYIRIADYSKVTRASINTRILYANTLNRLNSEYHCHPSITYICGASILLKTMLRLFASYVKQKLIFVPTLQDAFDLINNRNGTASAEKLHQITVSSQEMDEFAAECGHILFDEFYTIDETKNFISPNNPLHPLYTIISLLNDDLRELKRTEKEQKQKIKATLEHARVLNKELSDQKKNIEEKEQIQQILIENLKLARENAEIASEAKSEFLANISHEIRTPLHAVLGMTELLLYTALNNEQKNYTDTILTSAKQLHHLINDILDFSKIESGQLDQEKSLFDLRILFDDISSILAGSALKKSLPLTFTIPSTIPPALWGNAIYLRQALINLVQNAIKFTYKGKIVVSAEPVSETPFEFNLRISVKDTGIGIPEEKKELIFQRFTQLDSSATRKEGGTGLGLAIATQLISFMGGSLRLNSCENEGSEFWFILSFRKPKKESDTTETNASMPDTVLAMLPETASECQKPVDSTPPKNPRILLVEDNIINQQVATAMLTKLAYTVDISVNGLEAIEALKKKPYALVIMDLQMPHMGGFEATKNIRKPETGVLNPNIPVIALTANATKEDRENCLKAGMNDFITKPVMMQVLQELLQKWAPRSQ